jgi:hypothetical protein
MIKLLKVSGGFYKIKSIGEIRFMSYPKKTSFVWVSTIRKFNLGMVLLLLFGFYLALNTLFSIAYFELKILKCGTGFFDYIYFSFVTSFTIGYGDFVPLTDIGKFAVILQSSITGIYYALMVSVLSIKLLYPEGSIIFSKKIIYDSVSEIFIFRVINTNREALINPELRISVTEHNVGNCIAGVVSLPIDYNLVYLGKHDFSYYFKNILEFNNKYFNVFEQAKLANKYNQGTNSLDSRFRINISITGSYGLQQIAVYKKYYANEIESGKSFKPITYNDEDQKTGTIKYSKFPNIWTDFEYIEK